MKKIILIFFFALSTAYAKEDEKIDINIEKGIEIFGFEERPRIIFILPEYNPDFMVFKVDKDILGLEKIVEKDLFRK